ncbi:MAG: chemotaxis protein CheA, partial [Pirellulaceae bacterium]|nr:chemotaxis protein CheA [Pirellulaceae bacterium]
MTFDDPGLVAEFVVESNEHLADVENQLLTIESNGANVDVDLVNTVFRAVHSIKGVAGFLGLTSINNLAHSLENVLNQMRNLELAPTSENVDVMLRAADMLRNMINDVENSNDVDVSALVVELDAVSANEPTPAPAVVESAAAESTAPAESATTDEPAETDEPAATAETPAVPPAVETPAAEPAPATAETPPAPTKAVAKEHPADSKAVSKPAVESSIRVPVSVLDSLMNLAGELVLGRNQLMQTVTSLDKSGLEGVASRLDQVTSEMQEAIMQTRMQPIGTVFSRFTRVVRDLSNKLQKKCDLIIEGKEVEVDKSIIEAIGDPLTHLIRNSVDHGIEIPDERAQSSKTETGTIQLRAYHKAGKVRIDIQDDGRGINSAQLKEKAVTKGLITAEQAEQMGEREAVRLIFHPGFSTAAAVSDVSGRGVGMDVVRTNIERLGGAVDVETGIGVGTTVKVTLPLTLAIIPSLIVG